MNARGMLWGVGVMVASWVGCGPAELVGEPPPLLEQTQTQDSPAPGAETGAGGRFCGGFAAVQCPRGFTCVDDPSDGCDPAQGGRDCGGVCQADAPACGSEPGYTYVLRDPAQCAAAFFTCPVGRTAFFNDCGCGCRPR